MRTYKASWSIAVGCIASMASAPTLSASTSPQVPSTLSSRLSATRPADDPKDLSKPPKARAPNPKPPDVSFKPVKLIPIAVLVSGHPPDDSAATIIQRDLAYGDKLTPVTISGNAFADDLVNFSAMYPAMFAVRIVPASDGLTAELYDIASRDVRQSRHFKLPVVRKHRDAYLRDSLAQALAEKAQYARAAQARNAFMRDSVYALLWTPRPKFRRKDAQDIWIRDSTVRASHMDTLTARATALMTYARQDTIDANAALPGLLARETVLRDSLQREIRWALHGVADEIHQWITGERGIAQSRIAYVQNGLVRIVDFDGANDRAVTQNGRALSPAWHPSGRSIVFTDMNDAGMQIAEVQVHSGGVRFFNATPRGLNITPVYTRDGRNIIYAHDMTGQNTDLVMIDVRDSTTPLRRIAALGHANLAPCLNPDGTRIAFMSSRPKTPQIYSMNLDGSGERLETPFAAGIRSYRAGPDWSPDGRMIAYEQQNGDFQVWSIDVETQRVRQLTNVGENEDPTWAPNARHIALTSTRGGSKVLWILDTESGRYRQLTRTPGARLAAWSPMLATGK